MKISALTFIKLDIPFVNEFTHASKTRQASDAFILRIQTEAGEVGYGEALVRPYVTGETLPWIQEQVAQLSARLSQVDWSIDDKHRGILAFEAIAEHIDEILASVPLQGIIAPNGLRCALELAIVDACLREQKTSLAKILPPCRKELIYSAIISSDADKSEKIARHFKQLGMKDYKLKISSLGDINIVKEVRTIIGSEATLRLDANSAFTVEEAIALAKAVEPQNIAAIEQPIKRGDMFELAQIQSSSSIAIMADESLVTLADANELIAKKGARFFNIRLAKCGGIYPCLKLIELARANSIEFQIGCLVGETALLSAVGRHLAAFLHDAHFLEGSFGTLLLKEDISKQSVRFGFGGRAPLMQGIGFGIEVDERVLIKYSST